MDKGIYTALSGGIAKSHELELVANNLANANTPGFKGDTGTFNEYLMELRRPDTAEGTHREIQALTMQDGRPPGDKSFVEMDAVYTNFAQGTMNHTGRKLDVGLEGKGFFEVLTPAGLRYTRAGNFNIGANGKLVTASGFPVLARALDAQKETKRLEISPDGKVFNETTQKSPNLDPRSRTVTLGEGQIEITPGGVILQNGTPIATLAVTEFKEPQWLEKVGNSFFRNDHPDNVKDQPETAVMQGFLEGSNVNPVKEMTRLIEVTRSYESHMQAIKTYQEIDGRSVNDIARER